MPDSPIPSDARAVHSRADLIAVLGRRRLEAAVRRGDILRLRRGVYSSPLIAEPIRRAVTIGGVLGCVSAAAEYGLWVPPGVGTHVAVPRAASRLRGPSGAPLSHGRADCHLHWWPLADTPTEISTSFLDALGQVVRCQPRRFAVAVLDSGLHAGLISPRELPDIMSRAPRSLALPRDWFDPASESGIESLVRFALQRAGLRCESQVVLPGIGRVDLLVEGSVIVEVDGRAWHRGEQLRDYRRDLLAARSGARTVRVDYHHALYESVLVVGAVLRACRGKRVRRYT